MINVNNNNNNIRVEGKGSIRAEIVADSINTRGDRVTTYRLHYPRFIHSEFMTHRMVSKNASSSRAIPVDKQLNTIEDNPAMPIHWGLNEPGMQANSEATELDLEYIRDGQVLQRYDSGQNLWEHAAISACEYARTMWKDKKGYHKQIVNRLTEAFTFMNVVATATDWENFFWLRYHADAQPEICELARVMYEAREQSTPQLLNHGEWHTPYVCNFRDNKGMLQYCSEDGDEIYTLEEALKISASCCAQASYRALDQSLEKGLGMYDRLVGGEPLHASPFEHPCTPYSDDEYDVRDSTYNTMFNGLMTFGEYTVKQADKMCQIVYYNGNFRGFTQFRKGLDNENITKTFEKV